VVAHYAITPAQDSSDVAGLCYVKVNVLAFATSK
jgi:hypothetical protein